MYKHVVGGQRGHVLRRMIHVLMLFIPVLHYQYTQRIANYLSIEANELLVIVLLLCIIFEALRLHRGWVLLGQRHNEAKRISALAWGAVSIITVFLFVPGGYGSGIRFALPLIASLALVDPLMGEMRARGLAKHWQFLCGYLLACAIWSFACYFYQLSYVYVLILPLLTVLAEWPNLKWIDDNALMLWLPLIAILLLHHRL